MSNDFETRVYPLVTAWAGKVFKDDEQRAQDAVGVCWYAYQQNPRSATIPATQLAWMAIQRVRFGRRWLPGERSWGSSGNDALDRPFVHGAGMHNVRDKSPGPARLAEQKEEWVSMLGKLNRRQLEMVGLAHLDLTTSELAEMFSVTRARVSQLRREILELTKE